MNRLPSQYAPLAVNDFVGPARNYARLLNQAVKDAREADNAPIKVMLNGDPGVGKSSLARYFISLLHQASAGAPDLNGFMKWSVKKYSGVDVDIDTVRGIAMDLHYKDLFGSYRIIWVEEADRITPTAQDRFLLLLDDIPNACAVVGTSNCKDEGFKKRFSTRFKMLEVDPPSPQDVAALLRRFPLDPRDVNRISTFACGNVRAALLDAETALQAARLAA